ncbi:MAG: hypothetical protein RIR26_2388 [Pseudomonadota bacterium]|jgi:hypothetical protein
MTKSMFSKLPLLGCITLAGLGIGCQRQPEQARVQFVRTAADRAILEKRDLKDTFLFGLNVIETKNFFGNALNLNFRPVESQLLLDRSGNGQTQLVVAAKSKNGLEKLLAFDVLENAGGKLEVDFATAGNDLSLWNSIGGATIDSDAGRDAGSWQTVAQPKVVQVEQDADNVIVDIVHSVSFTLAKEPASGEQTRQGEVKIRLFLKRQVKNPSILNRTAAAALGQNIGFFPAERKRDGDQTLPIAHYKVDVASQKENQVIVYLKDFPSEFVDVGRQAVESWNISFGFNAFKAEIATENMDLGDPRYNVIKWIDGLDEDVPWAGYAPTMVNPLTGEVIATQVLINGSTTRKGFEDIYKYTAEAVPQFSKLAGKIGSVPLVEGAGENPVVSFFADAQSKTSDEYVKGYYFSVIMHEFGHSLGLRHNFAGSTKIDANGISSSVMDYEPGFVTNIRRVPGSYDNAAVRWGYFGENPQEQLSFCTDEDMSKRYDCNQGDVGNPVSYVVAGLIQGTTALENLTVALPAMVQKPMKGMMKTALKILDMQNQLPQGERETAVQEINRALNRVRTATASGDVSAADRATVEANLKKLAASYADVTAPKTPAPVALTSGW